MQVQGRQVHTPGEGPANIALDVELVFARGTGVVDCQADCVAGNGV